MFAPPPVQLSRAEIHSRLVYEEKSVEPNESPDKVSEKSNLFHRSEQWSPISPFKRLFFSKADRSKASPQTITASSPPFQATKNLSGEGTNLVRPELETIDVLPAGFGEHPRAAPVPPEREVSALNPRTSWVPPLPGAFPPPRETIQESPYGDDTAPPIPRKSPRRTTLQSLGLEITQPPYQPAMTNKTTFDVAIRRPEINGYSKTSTGTLNSSLQRASTEPSVRSRKRTSSTPNRFHGGAMDTRLAGQDAADLRDRESQGIGQNASKQTGVRNARVHKSSTASRQTPNATYHGSLRLEIPRNGQGTQRRASDGAVRSGTARVPRESMIGNLHNYTPTNLLSDRKSMQNKSVMLNEKLSHVHGGEALPRRLKFIDKELPVTPTSLTSTPTEILEYAPKSPRPLSKCESRRLEKSKRSPLRQASLNGSLLAEEGVSPNRLSAIPENMTSGEKSQLIPDSTTLVQTHIHLSGGSRVTLSPPELSAWQLSIYLQGPIKLPKPAIVPRKNSVASLDPFQEAIEHLYQDALSIPRRRSDDKVLDDVCDFFDDFGFEGTSFRGEFPGLEKMKIEDIAETGGNDPEQSKPRSIEVSPVEKTVARDITKGLDMLTKSPQSSSHARRDSSTLAQLDTGMQLLFLRSERRVADGSHE